MENQKIESMEKKKSTFGTWGIVLVIAVAAVVLAIYFNKASHKVDESCDSLQPGVNEGDLYAFFGKPVSSQEVGAYTQLVYNSDQGLVHARSNSRGKIVMLQCFENKPATWTV